MFSKTAKILLAASAFGGLDVPAKAGIYMPPKPAIVKAENLEFSKHMLLAMPLTMGILAKRQFEATVGTYRAGFSSGGTASTSFTSTAVPLGTETADRLVAVIWLSEVTVTTVTVTVGSETLTQNFLGQQASTTDSFGVYSKIIPAGTSANVTLSMNASGNVIFAVYTIKLGSAKETPADTGFVYAAATSASTGANFTIPTGGFGICAAINNGSGNMTWTNATEHFEGTTNSGARGTAASRAIAGSTSVSVAGSLSKTIIVFASWGV
jgi:hypothetical protein